MNKQTEELKMALNKAFQLGQRYWSWADSEYSSHWKKADAAKSEFDQLVQDTINAALAEQPAQHEPVECQYGKGGYACCEGGPCKADEQNNAPQPAQQQEPVAWMNILEDGYKCLTHNPIPNWTPLYTSPQAQEFVCSTGLCHYRKPLTDEEIQECWYKTQGDAELFARAIEAAHGIKENT